MSPENQGVFQLLNEVTFFMFYHSSTASVWGSFARHSSVSFTRFLLAEMAVTL